MSSFPVIGVPIVNGVHWLKRLINSVDFPVDNFFIVNNNGKNEITSELNELVEQKHNFIQKFYVSHLPSNIGCAGAYNLIIKSFIMSPSWIITGNDIAFTPGFLQKMYEKSQNPKIGIVNGARGQFNLGTWDLFLIKDWIIEKFGLFDENFYPAYCEDIDYIMRILRHQDKRDSVDLPYYHGDTFDYSISGSQTIKTDNSLKNKMDIGRWINENEYMIEKWGPNWRNCETYPFPFNIPQNTKLITKFDLQLCRRKYTGF